MSEQIKAVEILRDRDLVAYEGKSVVVVKPEDHLCYYEQSIFASPLARLSQLPNLHQYLIRTLRDTDLRVVTGQMDVEQTWILPRLEDVNQYIGNMQHSLGFDLAEVVPDEVKQKFKALERSFQFPISHIQKVYFLPSPELAELAATCQSDSDIKKLQDKPSREFVEAIRQGKLAMKAYPVITSGLRRLEAEELDSNRLVFVEFTGETSGDRMTEAYKSSQWQSMYVVEDHIPVSEKERCDSLVAHEAPIYDREVRTFLEKASRARRRGLVIFHHSHRNQIGAAVSDLFKRSGQFEQVDGMPYGLNTAQLHTIVEKSVAHQFESVRYNGVEIRVLQCS